MSVLYNLQHQHAGIRMSTTQVQQVDLWGKEGLKYSVEHARAKLAMLGGGATREEEERQVEDGAQDDNFEETAVNVDLKK